jgi:hypothetical protein
VIKHPFSGLRLAAASAAVIGLVVLSAAPVAADTTPPGSGYFTQSGSSAAVDASSCISNGDDTETCVNQSIGIFSGKMTDSLSGVTHSNQLCVSIYSFTYSDVTGEYSNDQYESGCRTDLTNGTIRLDSKLNGASLTATTLTIEAYACDKIECVPGPARDVTVSGTWTGFGTVSTSKYRSSFDDGFCRSNEAFKGSGRSATFAGTFDGQPVDGEVSAGLSTGRSSFRSRCVEV